MGIDVDNFAGGGGASTGIEAATGRAVAIAINHDEAALAMHTANHPETTHLCENVWAVDPRTATKGRAVDIAWFSPDCTHFSKAKGSKPKRSKRIRGLAWIVLKWAGLKRPRLILLENVEEFETWGPLTRTGRPCPKRKGMTFKQFVSQLRDLGYAVEWRTLRACDYGAPTIRQRLFLIARCDGQPIVWPRPTHGPGLLGLKPYRTAADIIDWSIPCPSIFERKKPLAEATLRRIAKGVQRYVIDAAEPFIVSLTHHGGDRVYGVDQPIHTVTGAHRGEKAIVVPVLVGAGGPAYGGKPRDANQPFATVMKENHTALVAAFLAQHNTDMVGHDARKPVSTIVGKGCTQALVASHLVKLRGTSRDGQPVTEPVATVTGGGMHLGEVRAFLVKYFATAIGQPMTESLHTATAKARFGLVTVKGELYQIADIGMRMLSPRELFSAQGFPASYIIERGADGKPLTKTQQIRMCGNSVCPPVAEALVRANCAFIHERKEVAA
jgi:DNA (cytosine-5)-methyltransferase 1